MVWKRTFTDAIVNEAYTDAGQKYKTKLDATKVGKTFLPLTLST